MKEKKYSTELCERTLSTELMREKKYSKKSTDKKICQKEPDKVERKNNFNQTGKKILHGKIPYRKVTEKF